MGLGRKLADLREKQILEHAEPFLDEGEAVLAWVRTTRPHSSSRGFLFATERRLVVSWSKVGPDENKAIRWDEIRAWGLASDGGRGPLLAIETEDSLCESHLLVGTDGMVESANRFLVHLVDKAPPASQPLTRVANPSAYRTTQIKLERERRTVRKHTRRAVVTIIGLCLIVVAFLIGWIPGPWSIPLVLAGLAVLATEYDWADDFLTWVRQRYLKTKAKLKARRSAAP
jgi:Putative transmembrane protein (PGPGW)